MGTVALAETTEMQPPLQLCHVAPHVPLLKHGLDEGDGPMAGHPEIFLLLFKICNCYNPPPPCTGLTALLFMNPSDFETKIKILLVFIYLMMADRILMPPSRLLALGVQVP